MWQEGVSRTAGQPWHSYRSWMCNWPSGRLQVARGGAPHPPQDLGVGVGWGCPHTHPRILGWGWGCPHTHPRIQVSGVGVGLPPIFASGWRERVAWLVATGGRALFRVGLAWQTTTKGGLPLSDGGQEGCSPSDFQGCEHCEVHRKAGWVESDDSAVDFANIQGNLNTYFCFIY